MTTDLNELNRKIRCPKGMKLPGEVKTMAAFMPKEKARFFMRAMGVALHEQASKMRSNSADRADKTNK